MARGGRASGSGRAGAAPEEKDFLRELELLRGAQQGDVRAVRRVLDAGVDVDAKDHRDATALCWAAVKGYLAIVQLLLEKGADVNARDKDGETPLNYALRSHHFVVAIVKLLVEDGADVRVVGKNCETPLMRAVLNGRIKSVQLLVEKDANVNSVDKDGNTALIWAVRIGRHDLVQLLLEKDAEVNAVDNDGNTALIWAVRVRHVAYRHVRIGRLDIVQLLLEKDADVDAREGGKTALFWAAYFGYLGIVQLLLEKGADVDAENDDNDVRLTALMIAANRGHLGVVDLLLQKDADVDAKSSEGCTALRYAMNGGHLLHIAKVLLKKGADVNAKDNVGWTTLHRAVRFGEQAEAHFLLEHGAVAVIADDKGRTPLYYALRPQNGEPDVALICRMLLQSGELVQLAESGRKLDEAELERMRLDLEQAVLLRYYGEAAFHWAAAMGFLSVVQLLVEQGADVKAKNIDGWTPLHMAAYCGQKAVAYFLLERGAVAVTVDNERRTPLGRALRPWGGEPDVELICKMLLPSGALIDLATDVVEAHEKRQRRRERIALGLRRAVESAGFLEGLADTLAGIDASGCARGTGAMLAAVLLQLKAFANEDGDALQAARVPNRRHLGEAYEERRRRHRLGIKRAVRGPEFLSGLAEGLAGVKKFASEPVAPERLVAAAAELDVLAEEAARGHRRRGGGA